MDSKREFFERLARSTRILPGDAPGTATERTAPDDAERRRRFLLRALASGVGLVALRNSGLAAALASRAFDNQHCTTSLSYITSHSSSSTFPSARSSSTTQSMACTGDYSWSATEAESWTETGPVGGWGTINGTTFSSSGSYGKTWEEAGTSTHSYSCANGSGTWTSSHPSHGSYTSGYTDVATVSLTINIPCKAPDGDGDGGIVLPDLQPSIPPTMDAERPVRDPRSRSAQDFKLDFGARR